MSSPNLGCELSGCTHYTYKKDVKYFMANLDMKYVDHGIKIIVYWGNLYPLYLFVST